MHVGDLPLKGHERLFRERVPLGREERARISVSDPWDYGTLAEAVEAWGFRAMQDRGSYMDRREVAHVWFTAEYLPVVEMLKAGELIDRGETEADAYMRISAMRYRALRTHEWSEEVLEELRRARGSRQAAPPAAAGAPLAPAPLRRVRVLARRRFPAQAMGRASA